MRRTRGTRIRSLRVDGRGFGERLADAVTVRSPRLRGGAGQRARTGARAGFLAVMGAGLWTADDVLSFVAKPARVIPAPHRGSQNAAACSRVGTKRWMRVHGPAPPTTRTSRLPPVDCTILAVEATADRRGHRMRRSLLGLLGVLAIRFRSAPLALRFAAENLGGLGKSGDAKLDKATGRRAGRIHAGPPRSTEEPRAPYGARVSSTGGRAK